ncbi:MULTISPECIES: hypothetical protein [unclassified Streptomyces]|uniref:hypothetical protein n=1 Tax=unclassified Streptomyces TaxID=2593676 RepID=UPI0006AE4285|nr:hypothetical protein [Streptomyces sp. WM6368]KOU22677.1 hypothetical protein ADK51_19760 [Streptomyces sp. WM6368]
MPGDPTGGYVENPRETKYMLTQDVGDVTRFMEGAELLGTGIQVRRVAKPTNEDPYVFREWWEVTVYDDPHLARKRPGSTP